MSDDVLKSIIVENHDALVHIGVLRRSGRYPWGSGKNPMQRSKDFLGYVDDLRGKGLSDKDIVDLLNLNSREAGFINSKSDELTTTQLRAAKAISNNMIRAEKEARAEYLKYEKKMSNIEIGKEMGINESSVRSLLDPGAKARREQLTATADLLRARLEKDQFLDIGVGTENHLGVTNDKLAKSVAILQEEGYEVKYIKVKQLGTGQYTTTKVLAPPGTQSKDIYADISKIASISETSDTGGRSNLGIRPIENLKADRISIRYAEDGGAKMDGVIELRRGVPDLDMGKAKYAQVRIGVEGTHYIKGMAVYADDLPDGVDIRFNTNKTKETPMLGQKDNTVLKEQKRTSEGKVDKDNPFGATIKPYDGQRGALNIVNEEGDWSDWSRSLPSQMLSKQRPELAKQQLDMTYMIKREQLNEIESLTNPTVKKKLLQSYSDDLDSSAVHLKAAALPRQGTHVILPIPSMKDTEIYAPKYDNGEKVILVRFPHAGTFEIPELTVNNKNRAAKATMQNAKDAVGINPKVAEQLSGADFDGDTVLVIPNNSRKITTSPPLAGLKSFEPKIQYKGYEGMKRMTSRQTQLEMGKISNLITDMTIKDASHAELERAVKHSMVVIDAEKHGLNYKQSEKDNAISQLKAKYQGGPTKGASTLISKASSEERVDSRRPRPASMGGPIDPVTGKKVYIPKDDGFVNAKGKLVKPKISSTKMAETDDAHTLSSGRPIEVLYADHANRLKGLANEARKAEYATKDNKYSPAAKVAYKSEVESLDKKLNVALMNAPIERKAQIAANATVQQKRAATPHLDEADLKKISYQALAEARNRVGAGKTLVDITPSEWTAIQAGAISANKLEKILNNADIDVVKKLATPRAATVMTSAKLRAAKALLDRGYTQAEVAAQLGVPASTLDSALER